VKISTLASGFSIAFFNKNVHTMSVLTVGTLRASDSRQMNKPDIKNGLCDKTRIALDKPDRTAVSGRLRDPPDRRVHYRSGRRSTSEV
jgi:hypothetical protein